MEVTKSLLCASAFCPGLQNVAFNLLSDLFACNTIIVVCLLFGILNISCVFAYLFLLTSEEHACKQCLCANLVSTEVSIWQFIWLSAGANNRIFKYGHIYWVFLGSRSSLKWIRSYCKKPKYAWKYVQNLCKPMKSQNSTRFLLAILQYGRKHTRLLEIKFSTLLTSQLCLFVIAWWWFVTLMISLSVFINLNFYSTI